MKLAKRALAGSWRLRRLLGRRRPQLLVACMPKSASTFLSNALSILTGFPKRSIAYAEESEQDLYLPKLIDYYGEGTVSQHHVRGTRPNLELMQQFGMRPIVLVRNLFDVVISLRDHMERESRVGPQAFWTDDYPHLDPAVQLDAIIDLALPWFFNFYVSWHEATRAKMIECEWVAYEEFVTNPMATLERVTTFLKVPASREAIARALQDVPKAESRMNQGVPGRGLALLSAAQMERIRSQTRYYPSVDFCRIGL